MDEIIIGEDGKREFQKTTEEERLLAMLIYLLSFFTTFIGPLLIWLLKKETSSFIDYHGKEYFNFIISYFIYSVIGTILLFILIGIPILIVVGAAALIFTIIAAIKAFQGERYRIPFIFRIIS